jgi:hypothetical protein
MRSASDSCVMWRRRRAREISRPSLVSARITGGGRGRLSSHIGIGFSASFPSGTIDPCVRSARTWIKSESPHRVS